MIPLSENPEDRVTIHYKPEHFSPAKLRARGQEYHWASFHETLGSWDLTIPNNVLEVWKKNAPLVVEAKRLTETLDTLKGKRLEETVQKIQEIESSFEEAPEPDFSSSSVIPLEEGIIAQIPTPVLSLLSVGLSRAMFPNLPRDAQSEGTF